MNKTFCHTFLFELPRGRKVLYPLYMECDTFLNKEYMYWKSIKPTTTEERLLYINNEVDEENLKS